MSNNRSRRAVLQSLIAAPTLTALSLRGQGARNQPQAQEQQLSPYLHRTPFSRRPLGAFDASKDTINVYLHGTYFLIIRNSTKVIDILMPSVPTHVYQAGPFGAELITLMPGTYDWSSLGSGPLMPLPYNGFGPTENLKVDWTKLSGTTFGDLSACRRVKLPLTAIQPVRTYRAMADSIGVVSPLFQLSGNAIANPTSIASCHVLSYQASPIGAPTTRTFHICAEPKTTPTSDHRDMALAALCNLFNPPLGILKKNACWGRGNEPAYGDARSAFPYNTISDIETWSLSERANGQTDEPTCTTGLGNPPTCGGNGGSEDPPCCT